MVIVTRKLRSSQPMCNQCNGSEARGWMQPPNTHTHPLQEPDPCSCSCGAPIIFHLSSCEARKTDFIGQRGQALDLLRNVCCGAACYRKHGRYTHNQRSQQATSTAEALTKPSNHSFELGPTVWAAIDLTVCLGLVPDLDTAPARRDGLWRDVCDMGAPLLGLRRRHRVRRRQAAAPVDRIAGCAQISVQATTQTNSSRSGKEWPSETSSRIFSGEPFEASRGIRAGRFDL